MKKTETYCIIGISFSMLLVSVCGISQQSQYNNQYLLNKYSLSPAFAGANENIEAFILYRKSWLGVAGAPEHRGINANGRINDKMGIGATVQSELAGIFRTFSGSFGYAYHLRIGDLQSLSFGVSGGAYENHIDIGAARLQSLPDPVAIENQSVRSVSFNGGAGLVYRWRSLSAGAVMPTLLTNTILNKNKEIVYTTSRNYLVHASYLIHAGKMFQIEPMALVRGTTNTAPFYEASALVRYKRQVWLGTTYRKGNMIAVSVGGAPHQRMVFGYSYEIAGGIATYGSGTHEFNFGFLLAKSKSPAKSSSVFGIEPKQPYYQWIEK